jgi:cysteine desulfurase
MEVVAYLDHAAATPLRPEAAEAMAPFADQRFANPSGVHALARDARRAVEEAREEIAELVGARPGEVVFTSGGTEADNLAVFGTLARCCPGPTEAVCSAIEHAAVLGPMRAAARRTAAMPGLPSVVLHEVPVSAEGVVDLDALAAVLGPQTALVSVMTANNEVGTLQPIADVSRAVRERAPGALLHTDAVQAAAYLDLVELVAPCDLVSLSSHKLGGPKGVGALVVRSPHAVAPVLLGGGQEQDRRSGTHNVAGIVGFAAALRVAVAERAAERERVRQLRDRFADALLARVPGVVESVPRASTLPGHCHLRFEGLEQDELLVLLDRGGVCASAGSACASGALEPSHVLVAMGLGRDQARSGVRFTLGHTSTKEEIDHAIAVVAQAVACLRTDPCAE